MNIESQKSPEGFSEPAETSLFVNEIDAETLLKFINYHFPSGKFTREQLKQEFIDAETKQTGSPAVEEDVVDIIPYKALVEMQNEGKINADDKGNYWITKSA